MIRTIWLHVYITWVTFCYSCWVILRPMFVRNRTHKQNKAEVISRRWMQAIVKIVGIRVIIQGKENIDPSKTYLIVSNHLSSFDIPVMGYLGIPFSYISTPRYFKIPVFGWAMKQAGYISIDRDKMSSYVKALRSAAQQIRSGRSVLLFPEGTRSPDGFIQPFKKGVLSVAYQCREVDILPVSIYGTREVKIKGCSTIQSGKVFVSIAKPIHVSASKKPLPNEKEQLLQQIEKVIRDNYDICIAQDCSAS